MTARILFEVIFDEVPLTGRRRECSIRLADPGSSEHASGSLLELQISGSRAMEIRASDALQAMCLALAQIASVLSLRMSVGSRYYYTGSDEAIDFAVEYFLPIRVHNP